MLLSFYKSCLITRVYSTLDLGSELQNGGAIMRYEDRGASADKSEVHAAVRGLDQGLFPGAFCKILPDELSGDPAYAMLLHADGAGTKAGLAYLYWKECGDISVFRGIAQDAVVMNLDDMACSGALGPFVMSNTIGRNAKTIPGEIIREIILGYSEFASLLSEQGIALHACGGETADVGDLVRTLIVDCTLACRLRRDTVLDGSKLRPGLVIVGLESGGQAIYESCENSGLGSNGYTALRHELLSHYYKSQFPESFAPEITSVAYTGKHRLSDTVSGSKQNLGLNLLSPTRTYAPVIKKILSELKTEIAFMVNNTGGGQTKCIRFGQGLRYVKNNLFEPGPVFKLMLTESQMSTFELYRTLNMGHRLEIFCVPERATEIISISEEFGIRAQVIGHVEASQGVNEVQLKVAQGEFVYRLD